MGYEIDFLPVGQNEKSGDAIAIRFGNLYGSRNEQGIIVIDGGFKDDGQKLIDHIMRHYQTDVIDIVMATHPHGDHTAGLETVLKEMEVREFWMHRPWEETHTNNISSWFTDGRVTDKSVKEALRKSLDSARSLETIAIQREIPIIEPFVGIYKDFGFGRIDIAGPTKEYYESLLPNFAGTPESKGALANLMTNVSEKVGEVVHKIFESWDIETLNDQGETSAENNSSAITLLRIDGNNLLFTGDAGIPALTNAADLLEAHDITYQSRSFIQIPHHGSKRCIGPTILNRLVGFKLAEEQKNIKRMTAFCSCAVKGEPKHPSKRVTNAFRRRGASVFITKGEDKTLYINSPRHYSHVTELPFYNEVEQDE